MNIGIIVITHGELANTFKKTLFSIMGEKEKFESISISTSMTLDSLCASLKETVNKLNTDYIVVFTDAIGGSPCNASLMLCKEYKNMYVISGVNLSMLIAAVHLREHFSFDSIESYIDKVIEEAKKGICNVSSILNSKNLKKEQ